jgi:methionyl aminopeptidase
VILIKNKVAIEKMRTAGHLLAQVMHEVKDKAVEGATTLQIDAFIEKSMRDAGLKPECKGYGGYNHATCISLNDVIVHGIPSDKIVLKSGDFVKIDVVGSYKKYCADMSRYFFIGNVDPIVTRIAAVCQKALDKAIELCLEGNRLSDISACIQCEAEKAGFGVVRQFVSHGIGKSMHEDPNIPNYGKPGRGPVLQEGMTFAIEPMITQGSYEVKIMKDGWTAKTADGGIAAHVEDTVLITKHGPEILTRM